MTTKKKAFNAMTELDKLTQDKISISSTIRALREASHISQSTLAQKLGVSRSVMCDIENGRRIVSIETAMKIAKELHSSTNGLIALAIEDMAKRSGIKFKMQISDLVLINKKAA